jgi:predicted nucleic acid-binding protein
VLLLDASATVDLLLRNATGQMVRERIHDRALWSVSHLDAEVFSALARLYRDTHLDAGQVRSRLELLGAFDLVRLPITSELLAAAWKLRDNVAARDALYVAAARALRAQLLTTDRRLARAARNHVGVVDIEGGA